MLFSLVRAYCHCCIILINYLLFISSYVDYICFCFYICCVHRGRLDEGLQADVPEADGAGDLASRPRKTVITPKTVIIYISSTILLLVYSYYHYYSSEDSWNNFEDPVDISANTTPIGQQAFTS